MGVTLYVLEGLTSGKRYVGITGDLERRLSEHRAGGTKGAQVIGDFRLIYTENHQTHAAARAREKFFKSGQGRAWLLKRIGRPRPA